MKSIYKIFLFSGLIISSTFCEATTLSEAADSVKASVCTFKEKLFCNFDFGTNDEQRVEIKWPEDHAGKWTCGLELDQQNYSIDEYIPSCQTIENWSEIFTVEFTQHPPCEGECPDQIDADQYTQLLIQNFRKMHDDLEYDPVFVKSNDVMYTLSFPSGGKNKLPETLICRTFSTSKGIHRLFYAARECPMDPVRYAYWFDFMQNNVFLAE